MSRGGARPGAGRKPAPAGTVKVAYGTKLQPEVVKYLRQCTNAAQTIEAAVNQSEAFGEWKSKQQQAEN